MRKGYFMSLKVSIVAILVGLMLMTQLQTAQAFSLTAKNDTERQIDFAIMYYDDSMNDWLCKGWYAIPANTTKSYSFPDSDQVDGAYLYAQSSGRVWSARSENEGKGAYVIGERFEYLRGSSTPVGSNKRNVYFRPYIFNDSGNISVRWTAGQG
jgi:uncharacterized membrane protein